MRSRLCNTGPGGGRCAPNGQSCICCMNRHWQVLQCLPVPPLGPCGVFRAVATTAHRDSARWAVGCHSLSRSFSSRAVDVPAETASCNIPKTSLSSTTQQQSPWSRKSSFGSPTGRAPAKRRSSRLPKSAVSLPRLTKKKRRMRTQAEREDCPRLPPGSGCGRRTTMMRPSLRRQRGSSRQCSGL